MQPKFVLPSLKCNGRHSRPTPIESLCEQWSRNKLDHYRSKLRKTQGQLPPDRMQTSSSPYFQQSPWLGWVCMAKHVGCSFQMVLYPTMTQHSKFNIAAILQSFPRGTSAGPSGLGVQHLLDVVGIPLPSPLCISLKSVVNLLASGKVPFEVSRYLAGGNLTALKKIKPNSPPDIRQIAVGETLRKLTGKCLCDLVRKRHQISFNLFNWEWLVPQGLKRLYMV